MRMKRIRLRQIDAILRGIILVSALSAIAFGSAYYWGIGAAALSVGALIWIDLTLPGLGNERNSSDSSKPPDIR